VSKEKALGTFEKYLSVWVILCIILGILLGRFFPNISTILSRFEYAHVSIPIAVCLFFMMYPIMVKIDFREVVKAGKTPKPVVLTLIVNSKIPAKLGIIFPYSFSLHEKLWKIISFVMPIWALE